MTAVKTTALQAHSQVARRRAEEAPLPHRSKTQLPAPTTHGHSCWETRKKTPIDLHGRSRDVPVPDGNHGVVPPAPGKAPEVISLKEFERGSQLLPAFRVGGGAVLRQEPAATARRADKTDKTVAAKIDPALLTAIPEDLRGGMRNGTPIIRLLKPSDVDRVPDGVWQFIADQGVNYQNRGSGETSRMSAELIKESARQGLHSPNARTNYYPGVALEQLAWSDRAKPPPVGTPVSSTDRGVSKWYDSQVLDAMKEATKTTPLTKGQLAVLAEQYQIPTLQFEKVYGQFVQGEGATTTRFVAYETPKLKDAEVRQAMQQALKDAPLTKYELKQASWQFDISDQQFERVYAELSGVAPTQVNVSPWYDAQVLQAMQEATKTTPLSKDQLAGLAEQYQIPPEQFERVYAQFTKA